MGLFFLFVLMKYIGFYKPLYCKVKKNLKEITHCGLDFDLLFLLDFDQCDRFYEAIWATISQDFENIRRHSRVILFFSTSG